MTNILDKHVGAYQGHNQYDFDNDILLNWYSRRIVSLARHANSILELGLETAIIRDNKSSAGIYNTAWTIRVTCSFPARPVPQTADLTCWGV